MLIPALVAVVVAILGAIPAFIGKQWRIGLGLMGAYCFSYFLFYLALPNLNAPFGGMAGVTTVVLMVLSGVITYTANDGHFRYNASPVLFAPAGVVTVILLFVLMFNMPACNTTRYSSFVGDIDKQGKDLLFWTQQTEELDPTHIRMIPLEHAMSLAKTALNQHGNGNIISSQFELADTEYATLQKIQSRLYYAIPLDYRNWGTWQAVNGIPGYILVNAEDRSEAPILKDGYKMVYSPGGYFSTDIKRLLYSQGYYNKTLIDYSFEVDDAFNPWWVVTVCDMTMGYDGLVVQGVVVANPQTGESHYYEKNSAPAWIDRIYPASLVNDYIGYWGRYINGFWNRLPGLGSQLNTREPEVTTLNYGADGMCYFVTPVTSSNGSDHTMTDLIYTNSRTGVSTRFIVSGATEEAILNTVDGAVKYQHLHATSVVYENVQDRLTAIVPVLAEDKAFRGVAFVDVSTKAIAVDPIPVQAFRKYQMTISQISSQVGTDIAIVQRYLTGTVSRITPGFSSAGNQFYLYLRAAGGAQNHIFGVSEANTEVLVTSPGDTVKIGFLDSPADLITANYFDNLSLDIKGSKNQQAVAAMGQQGQEDSRVKKSRMTLKQQILNNQVSDSTLDAMAKQLQKKQ